MSDKGIIPKSPAKKSIVPKNILQNDGTPISNDVDDDGVIILPDSYDDVITVTVPHVAAPESRWLISPQYGSGKMDDQVDSIVSDSQGNLYIAGHTEADINFGNGPKLINDGDYDFFLIKYDALGNAKWLISPDKASGTADDHLEKVFIAPNDEVYVAGYTLSNLDFGNGIDIENSGGYDFFVVRYSAVGKAEQLFSSKQFLAKSDDYLRDIHVDSSRNVYVAGETFGTINFGNAKNAKHDIARDFFIVKYDSEGEAQMVITAEECEGDDNIIDMHVDNSGNIYLVGYTDDDINFGSDIILENKGGIDFFIVRYDSSGKAQWVASPKFESGKNDDMPIAVEFHGDEIYLAGKTSGDINFGDNLILTNDGNYDFFLVRYDALTGKSLSLMTSEQDSGIGNDIPVSVFVKDPYIYLLGYTNSNIDFGNNRKIKNHGIKDSFIVRYDKNGEAGLLIYSRSEKTNGVDFPVDIFVDDDYNIYFAGNSESSLDFGNGITLDSLGRTDMFLVKYDSNAIAQWIITPGYLSGGKENYLMGYKLKDSGKKDDYIVDFVVSDGDMFIVGNTKGNLDFGNSNFFENNGEYDFFFARFS